MKKLITAAAITAAVAGCGGSAQTVAQKCHTYAVKTATQTANGFGPAYAQSVQGQQLEQSTQSELEDACVISGGPNKMN